MFAESSIRRRRLGAIAASLAIGVAAAGWTGCGSDDTVNNAIEDATGKSAEELQQDAQDALDQAQDQLNESN